MLDGLQDGTTEINEAKVSSDTVILLLKFLVFSFQILKWNAKGIKRLSQ